MAQQTPTDATPQTEAESASSTASEEDIRHYAVMAETVHDPHSNYTVLGRIVELDRSEYESDTAAANAAVEDAVQVMPEGKDEILDTELKVFEVKRPATYISLTDE